MKKLERTLFKFLLAIVSMVFKTADAATGNCEHMWVSLTPGQSHESRCAASCPTGYNWHIMVSNCGVSDGYSEASYGQCHCFAAPAITSCPGGNLEPGHCLPNFSYTEPIDPNTVASGTYTVGGACNAGYYGTCSSGCSPCPGINSGWSLNSGSITSSGGSSISSCYITSGAIITESGVGTFTANGNCPYS